LVKSTGAQNDLERITNMAFAMVAEYGMSEELGYISLKDSNSPNDSFGFNKKYSESTAQKIDDAVRAIILRNYKRTVDLLTKHKDKLEEMAETLLDKEVLNHVDLRDMLGDRPSGNYPEGIFESEDRKRAITNGSSVAEGSKGESTSSGEKNEEVEVDNVDSAETETDSQDDTQDQKS